MKVTTQTVYEFEDGDVIVFSVDTTYYTIIRNNAVWRDRLGETYDDDEAAEWLSQKYYAYLGNAAVSLDE
jgi:hypothetical protein